MDWNPGQCEHKACGITQACLSPLLLPFPLLCARVYPAPTLPAGTPVLRSGWRWLWETRLPCRCNRIVSRRSLGTNSISKPASGAQHFNGHPQVMAGSEVSPALRLPDVRKEKTAQISSLARQIPGRAHRPWGSNESYSVASCRDYAPSLPGAGRTQYRRICVCGVGQERLLILALSCSRTF